MQKRRTCFSLDILIQTFISHTHPFGGFYQDKQQYTKSKYITLTDTTISSTKCYCSAFASNWCVIYPISKKKIVFFCIDYEVK